jgi:hypothetical protein
MGSFVTLGQRVKTAKITNIDLDKQKNFPNGRNPNYAGMRAIVAAALNPVRRTTSVPRKLTTAGPSTSTQPKPAADDLTSACAYNPGPPG